MILISLDLGQTSTSKNGKNYQDKQSNHQNIQSKIDEFVKEEENVPKEPKEPKASKGPKVHPKDPKPVLKNGRFLDPYFKVLGEGVTLILQIFFIRNKKFCKVTNFQIF